MSVVVPISISTTGIDTIKKIKEEISQIRNDIEEIKEFKIKESVTDETEIKESKNNIIDKSDTKESQTKTKENISDELEITDDSIDETKEEISKESKADKKDINEKIEQVQKEPKENPTKINKILEQDLGVDKAKNILGYATNPTGAVLQQLFKIGALPATLIGAPVIAAKVIEFLQQEGNILDRFFDDRIDNRLDALRDKTKQQRILQGFDSLIISTIDGDFNPRNTYNSFEVRNNDRGQAENDLRVRKVILHHD